MALPDDGTRARRSAFTIIELVIVLSMLAVISAMAIPKLNISQYRADAAAQQVRSVFQTAQRTSLTRQYDVIVSIDTVQMGLRIAEDQNNNGAIEISEWKFWRPLGEGNRLSVPPKGLNNTTPTVSIVASPALISVGGLPSVIFHRDGSSGASAEIYMSSTYKGRTDSRLVTLTRASGRTELYRLSTSGSTYTWQVVQ